MIEILNAIENTENFELWILISSIIIPAMYFLMIIGVRIYDSKINKKWNQLSFEQKSNTLAFHPDMVVDRICEVIISDTCILSAFLFYFYITDSFLFLSDYNGFILLFIILVAVVLNNFIDIKLKLLYVDKKIGNELGKIETDYSAIANIRLVSSFLILIILIGFSLYFKTKEYTPLILSMLGLILGRFIYFDSSLKIFMQLLQQLGMTLIYTLLALLLTLIILGIGIYLNVINNSNFLNGIWGAHVFLLIIISSSRNIFKN